MTFPRADHPRNACGPRVRALRNAKGWSQNQLAAECQLAGWDISRDSIAQIEDQRRRVIDVELKTLARILGTTMEDLVPGDNVPHGLV